MLIGMEKLEIVIIIEECLLFFLKCSDATKMEIGLILIIILCKSYNSMNDKHVLIKTKILMFK